MLSLPPGTSWDVPFPFGMCENIEYLPSENTSQTHTAFQGQKYRHDGKHVSRHVVTHVDHLEIYKLGCDLLGYNYLNNQRRTVWHGEKYH